MGLTEDQLHEAERILGGNGTELHVRLGWTDADEGDAKATLLETISRWRQVGANPIAPRPVTALCDVMIRSCEGLYAQL